MPIIKPFKGYRPPVELVEEVESRPYDVLNSEEARQEAEGNPKSLYHIINPERMNTMRESMTAPHKSSTSSVRTGGSSKRTRRATISTHKP